MVLLNPASNMQHWDITKVTLDEDFSYVYLSTASDNDENTELKSTKFLVENKTYLELDIDLDDKCTKYLLELQTVFSHSIHDSLAIILKLHNLDPNAVFILYKYTNIFSNMESIYEYFEELFAYKNIKYLMIPILMGEKEDSRVVKVNRWVDVQDYIHQNNLYLTLADYLVLSNEIHKHIGPLEIEPYRKVYLSRSHINRGVKAGVPDNHQGYTDDLRMNNQVLLDEYFKSKGFEIVIPEHKFSTFREQIEYMRSVKLLASITSSGILNSFFMENEQTILEIAAELVFPHEDFRQTLVNHYPYYAYMKNHKYVAIPSRRDPLEVINRLEPLIEAISN